MIAGLQLVSLAKSAGEGAPPRQLMHRLAAEIERTLHIGCQIEPQTLSVDPLYDAIRGQAWSTAILARLQERRPPRDTVLLGVTALDLYVPVLTFVFGEAQLNGPCAVVSSHRLHEEYYGLPGNTDLAVNRMLKEVMHELGHTQGLRHCIDWRCVMSSAHTVERIDIRQAAYCRSCVQQFLAVR